MFININNSNTVKYGKQLITMSIVHTTKIQISQTKTECHEKYGLSAASFWRMALESLILLLVTQ